MTRYRSYRVSYTSSPWVRCERPTCSSGQVIRFSVLVVGHFYCLSEVFPLEMFPLSPIRVL